MIRKPADNEVATRTLRRITESSCPLPDFSGRVTQYLGADSAMQPIEQLAVCLDVEFEINYQENQNWTRQLPT